MTETLKWIYTKDHKPTFEECEGKTIVYHLESEPQELKNILIFRNLAHWNEYFEAYPKVDRYILIDIPEFIPDPEPVPCKVCGGKVEYVHDPAYDGDKNPYVVECTRGGHVISFTAPTRAEAIQLWNKWNGG